jgi:hypothetical protein
MLPNKPAEKVCALGELRRLEPRAASRAVFTCSDVATQTYQDGTSLTTVSSEASHPRAHAR